MTNMAYDVGNTVVSRNRIKWTIENFFSPLSAIKCKNFYFEGELFSLTICSPQMSTSWLEVGLTSLSPGVLSPYSVHFCIRKKSGEETESRSPPYIGQQFAYVQLMLWRTFVENKDELVPNGHLTIVCYILKEGEELAEVKSRFAQVSLNQLKKDAAVQTIEDTAVSSITSEIKDLFSFRDGCKAIYQTGEFCDFEIKVQDRIFRTHKLILAARSSAFASMLRNDMLEKKTGVVEIVDCDSETFEAFLKFLYGGKNEVIIPDNVVSLFEVANKYDVQHLKAECRQYMMENLSNKLFCDVMDLALRHDERELIKLATEYFKRNKKSIFLSVEWQIFLKENSTCANELLIKTCD